MFQEDYIDNYDDLENKEIKPFYFRSTSIEHKSKAENFFNREQICQTCTTKINSV